MSTRYTDIYHPRVDIRMVNGTQYPFKGNSFNQSKLFLRNRAAVDDGFQTLYKNNDLHKKPIEYTHLLSRAKVIDMKELTPVGNPEYQPSSPSIYDSRKQFQALFGRLQ